MPLSRTRDYMSIGEVLETIKAEFPDVSHLEDPVPRGRGPDHAREDGIRLSQVLRERRQAAPLHPGAAEGPLPAPEGHQGAPHRFRGQRGSPACARASGHGQGQREGQAGTARSGRRSSSHQRRQPRRATSSRRRPGLSEQQLAGLEDFGIIAKNQERFDGTDLTVAKAGKGLFEFGVEPRHMRMYQAALGARGQLHRADRVARSR